MTEAMPIAKPIQKGILKNEYVPIIAQEKFPQIPLQSRYNHNRKNASD